MWRWHMLVRTWILAYLCSIVFFATAYFLLPEGQFNERMSFMDALYFSVITITTTGFGDITARGGLARFFVSVEATAGVAIVGLFLASLWRDFTTHVESVQEAALLKSQRSIGLVTLLLYWNYIRNTILEYRRLADGLKKSSPTTETIKGFFEMEARLEGDLRYLVANEVVDELVDIRGTVFNVLTALRSSDAHGALLGMDEKRLGESLDHLSEITDLFEIHRVEVLGALDELEAAMNLTFSRS